MDSKHTRFKNLPRHFSNTMQRLFSRNLYPRAIVACSGGVDSVVLLELMRRYYQISDAQDRLEVIHFNHNQRPKNETRRDREVVQGFCEKYKIPFHFQDLGLAPGTSEQVMRQARYEALALHTKSSRATVFTAHHADDDLETYLFRLLRGTDPSSIRGIHERAVRKVGSHGRLRLARPLLQISKSDLIGFANKNGLSWNEDTTNSETRFARNRIRHELIALLDEIRPGASQRVYDFFIALNKNKAEPKRLLQSKVDLLLRLLRSKQGVKTLDADFAHLKSALDLLLGDHLQRTTRAHWENLNRHLESRRATRDGGGPAKTLQFPGGGNLVFRGNRLFWVNNS